jgi:hypothetical protein
MKESQLRKIIRLEGYKVRKFEGWKVRFGNETQRDKSLPQFIKVDFARKAFTQFANCRSIITPIRKTTSLLMKLLLYPECSDFSNN